MSDWIPVEERLPEATGGTWCLVSTELGKVYAAVVTAAGEFFYIMTGGAIKDVVAWMPYPEPYQKPRRFVVEESLTTAYNLSLDEGDRLYSVRDAYPMGVVASSIPTREAAEKIAEIYEQAYAGGQL